MGCFILTLFNLTVSEVITTCGFVTVIIGGIIQANVRMRGNTLKISEVEKTTNQKIEALGRTTDARITSLEKTTDAKIIALENGRKQNAENIETMRKENREDHDKILSKLDSLMGFNISLKDKK
ncbi:MAG: hypothetical protein M0R17_06450 [Candidatus Omnitrophica bacterium]|jgi:hypothetical protein|nr:hypothetical protein [Candidatus Omnitrophota bacterium]